MAEELPLTPEVRAIQADALRPLESPWPCDFTDCPQPASYGGRATCCHAPLLLCNGHTAQFISLVASAKLGGLALPCMHCGRVWEQPVTPSSMYSHSFHLTITAADARDVD